MHLLHSSCSAALSTTNFNQGRGQSSQGRGKGRNNSRSPMMCAHCNSTNHTIEICYFKHEFPPGYHAKNSNSSTQLAAASSTDIPRIEYPNNPAKTASNDYSFSISRDDYQYLINLIHSSKHDSTSAINTVNKHPSSNTSHHIVSGVTKTGTVYPEDDWTS